MEQVSFVDHLNTLFSPADKTAIQCTEGLWAGAPRILCTKEAVKHSIFWAILKTAFESGLSIHWQDEKKECDVLITVADRSISSLIFTNKGVLQIFKTHISEKFDGVDPGPRPTFISPAFLYKKFPELKDSLQSAKIIETFGNRKILVLTFSDDPSLKIAKELIERRLTNPEEAALTRKRKAVSLQIYESPQSPLSLNIEGEARLKLDLFCESDITSVLGGRYSVKRKRGEKAPNISPDVPWSKYTNAIGALKGVVRKVKFFTDCGRQILHLTLSNKESLDTVGKIVQEKLGNNPGVLIKKDPIPHIRIEGVALLALNYLSYLPEFKFH